jgi:hypothetical protein
MHYERIEIHRDAPAGQWFAQIYDEYDKLLFEGWFGHVYESPSKYLDALLKENDLH